MSPLKMMPLLASAILSVSTSVPGTHAAIATTRAHKPKARKANTGGNLRATTPPKISGTNVDVRGAVDEPNSGLFHYPDIKLNCCRSGSDNEHLSLWIEENTDNGYLYHDLVSCCEANFGTDVESCLQVSKEISINSRTASNLVEIAKLPSGPAVQQRRLAKSGKSDKSGKSNKASKSGAHYHHSHGWHGPHWHPGLPNKPRNTPIPTPKPVKPQPKPTPEKKEVEILLGGHIVADGMTDVPATGSQEITRLALAFEKTILQVLDDGFECDVHTIGGKSVGGGHGHLDDPHFETLNKGHRKMRGGTGLGGSLFSSGDQLPSTDVLFILRVFKPCPDCSDMDAVILGAHTFDEAFQKLGESAESGELSVIFCIYAEVAGIVSEPCHVSISSTEGTSLDVQFVKDGPKPSTPKPTPKPTSKPVMPTAPTTQRPTDMGWPPTPSPEATVPAPTLEPSSVSAPTTMSPNMEPTTTKPVSANPTVSPNMDPTTTKPVSAAPTLSPNMDPITTKPVSANPTASPNMEPTKKPVSTTPSVSPNMEPTTTKPVTTPPTISPVSTPKASVTPTSSPEADTNTLPTYAPTFYPTAIDTGAPTPKPTPTTTEGSVPTTIAPTSIPVGALYYDGFEKGTFPMMDPQWTTEGDELWELTTERVNSGVYSIKSPDLSNDEFLPKESNVTLSTNPAWAGGTLVFSALAGIGMPYDDVVYIVDDQVRGNVQATADFVQHEIELSAGPHLVTWQYKYNPAGLAALPPPLDGHIGAVYIDDVYFSPIGATVTPIGSPTDAPTPAAVPTTTAPTSTPPGSLYYDSFEQGTFPELDPEWTTEGDGGGWELSSERANSGVYSIKSPDLSNDEFTSLTSNVTINTNPAWGEGTLVFSVLAGTSIPYDDVLYYVDGEMRGRLSDMTDFETEQISLQPGPHIIVFSYKYNPLGLDALPPEAGERIGAVYIDDVYFLPAGATVAPVAVPGSASPVPSPEAPSAEGGVGGDGEGSAPPASAPSSAAPTVIPQGSTYFNGFEMATFPADPEWSTEGDGEWKLTTERSNSGKYSIKSPDLRNEGMEPAVANVTLVTDDSDAGTLVCSILAGVDMPFDNVVLYVDDIVRDQLSEESDFGIQQIQLGPGSHIIKFSYQYNPVNLEVFPPELPGRIGAVYIDDVYFLPAGITVAPTADVAVAPTPSPMSSGVVSSPAPTPEAAPSSAAPTAIPPGAEYYDGFEQATFPSDPEWSTEGDGVWGLTSEKSNSGRYSIKSPILMDLTSPDLSQKTSNVTIVTGDDWGPGSFVFSILGGVEMPFDDLIYYVDGTSRGQVSDMTDFETREIQLGPGEHEIVFSYKFNPAGIGVFPPVPINRIGAVYIDDVHFVPSGVTVPTPPVDSGLPTYAPTSGYPTYNPTGVPSSPNVAGTPTPDEEDGSFFDGFESGDLTSLEWETTGQQVWLVDDSNPYEGLFSAHVRTEDIVESGEYAQLDLDVTLDSAAFVQFYFFAPIAPPFESFDLRVDGQFLVNLSTEGSEAWTQAGAILSSGEHTVSWRLSKNAGGVPNQILENIEPPEWRVGEAWLDNVSLLAATPSFTENWESGDFSANPWVLSGDADWLINDSDQYEGEYSATMTTSAISGNSGSSELSLDIITEQGGSLNFAVLSLLSGPFDAFNVLIDDTPVVTFTSPFQEWIEQELDIQPGKRKVTFEYVKNPGQLAEGVISSLPPPPGYGGQLWLDAIEFVAT